VDENSLLEVDCSDLCVTNVRPGFIDEFYSSEDEFYSSEDEYADDVDCLCDWGTELLIIFKGLER
jgi:hypothetical protein